MYFEIVFGSWKDSRSALPPITYEYLLVTVFQKKRAAAAYGGALERGTGGRLEGDHVGAVTKDLADLLVSIPRTLPIPPITPQTDMRMPEPPMLSPAGRAALRAG